MHFYLNGVWLQILHWNGSVLVKYIPVFVCLGYIQKGDILFLNKKCIGIVVFLNTAVIVTLMNGRWIVMVTSTFLCELVCLPHFFQPCFNRGYILLGTPLFYCKAIAVFVTSLGRPSFARSVKIRANILYCHMKHLCQHHHYLESSTWYKRRVDCKFVKWKPFPVVMVAAPECTRMYKGKSAIRDTWMSDERR